jgi:hypothetical protein
MLATRSFEDIKRYFKGLKFLFNGFAYGPMPEDLRKKDGRN